MTVTFINPTHSERTLVRMVADFPVAEISRERGRFVLHFHPIADKLSQADKNTLVAAAAAKVNELNALADVAKRLLE